jgi:hypothetical protein
VSSPLTAGITKGLGGAFDSVFGGIQQYQEAGYEKAAANYNATLLERQGRQAEEAGAANEAEALRKSQAAVGEQAAGFGESNIGTGRTVQGVERQSQISGRMDALNQWYSGEIEGTNAQNEANLQKWDASVASKNQQNSLIGIGVGLGTSSLLGVAQYAQAGGVF